MPHILQLLCYKQERLRRKILTTMQRLFPPGRQDWTRRDTKRAEDWLLCLLTREGRAATTAWLRYRGQLSVGFGFKALRAACQIWENMEENGLIDKWLFCVRLMRWYTEFNCTKDFWPGNKSKLNLSPWTLKNACGSVLNQFWRRNLL